MMIFVLYTTLPASEVARTVVDHPELTIDFVPAPKEGGALTRAVEQMWHSPDWSEARRVVEDHQAFVRLEIGGAAADQSAVDQSAVDQLGALLTAADALLRLDGALAYFNEAGEVLMSRDHLWAVQIHALQQGVPPLDAWCNQRFFALGDGWMLADSVGHAQLGLPDVEVGFRSDDLTPDEASRFVRELGLEMLDEGSGALADGKEIDGPHLADVAAEDEEGGWIVKVCECGVSVPPRKTVRVLRVEDVEGFDSVVG